MCLIIAKQDKCVKKKKNTNINYLMVLPSHLFIY